MSGPLFPLGYVTATPGALDLLGEAEVDFGDLLRRHVNGDWGELDPHDRRENALAVDRGLRILSSYLIGGAKVWVITEADRSSTTFLLPEEY